MPVHGFDQPGLDAFALLSHPRREQQPGPFGPAPAKASAPTYETTADRLAAMERRLGDVEAEVKNLKGTANVE